MNDFSAQIPNLPPVIALAGSEQFEIVQFGVSCRVNLIQIAAFLTGNTYMIGTGFLLINLPDPADYPLGTQTYCLDGLNPGETTGLGSGCPVFVKSDGLVNIWCAIWSGVDVEN